MDLQPISQYFRISEIDFKINFNTFVMEIYKNGDTNTPIVINLGSEAKAKQIEKYLMEV